MRQGGLPQSGGVKREGLSGPIKETDDVIGHIEKLSTTFETETNLMNGRAVALEAAEKGRRARDAAKARESKAMASLGADSIDEKGKSPTPTSGGVIRDAPAVPINTILGAVFGVITLLGLTLNSDQHTAVIAVVTAVFALLPVIAGFIIRAINTRRENQ